MTDREIMQQALNALEHHTEMTRHLVSTNETIKALRARLAQPEQDDEKGKPMTYWGGLAQPEPYPENFIDALRFDTALREPEPVAWRNKDRKGYWQYRDLPILTDGQPLYTAPPQREWQGLTRKQLLQIWGKPENFNDPMRFARAIEAKLKEKNI